MFRQRNNKGFTLIEVLLAIFIFAIVISLIFTAYTGSIRIMNETDNEAGNSRQASIALERMTEDLESISRSAWIKPVGTGESAPSGRFLGENVEIDGQSADRIRFLSKARVVFDDQQPEAGVVEISYYLKKADEQQVGLVLYRSETPVLETSPAEGTGGLDLCRDLRSIKITYLNENGETVEEWDSASSETNNLLPRAVTITLSFKDPSGDEETVYPFRTSVMIPLSREQNGQLP